MKKDDGGPAFPRTWSESWGGETTNSSEPGMTLRDWFAGQALSGMLGGDGSPGAHWSAYALDAYAMADAMLEIRQPKKE